MRERSWPFVAAALFTLVAIAHSTGYLRALENQAADARARLLQRDTPSDVVIVGIDARSLADLQQWPWPRRYHARLLERLAQAAPRRVFLDIDFSSRTQPADDEALRAALARFAGNPVVLPMFFQNASGGVDGMIVSTPLPELARHAHLAGINFQPGADSLIRDASVSWDVDGMNVASAVAVLAPFSDESPRQVPIDFSISPASFEFISYVDLLAGRIDPAGLRDKTVLVGATAVELGDMLPVPVHRTQPGVVVQALALQSLREGPLRTLPLWLHALGIAGVSALAAHLFSTQSWRRNAIMLAGGLLVVVSLDVYAYRAHRLALEIVPALFVLGGAFMVTTIRSLDRETLRAFTYALRFRRRDALLASIVESSSDGIVCVTASGRIETANAAAARLFGCKLPVLLATRLDDLVPNTCGSLAASCSQVSERTGVRSNGSSFPAEISISAVRVQSESLYTVIIRDISERKAQERRLEHQATHDPLTGLPNRVALADHLERLLDASQTQPVALLMLDLCRFKEVNDTLGHHVGDQVLCEVARRFETATGAGFVARIGGDEFTVVCREQQREAVEQLAKALHESMRASIDAAGIAVDVGVSIGIAIAPEHATDAATLLRRADVAMYVSKRRGSAWEIYDPASDQHSVRRLAMVGDLRAAIAGSGLRLHYQPQIALGTGRSTSVEALLRWRHPEHGTVSPAEFITVAESTDLIRPLTLWTLTQALQQAQQWRRSGFEPRVAVNLSARVLQDADFPALLRALLQAHDAVSAKVELEITESAMMQDPARALRVIREIHELGVTISVDDFGTGYSSLAYLRDLPAHALKLDKCFVQNLQHRAQDRSIVNSTVHMAHELGLEVVAEGVESEWVARYLADAGYDYAQGYRYSPALPAAECRRWVEQFNAVQVDAIQGRVDTEAASIDAEGASSAAQRRAG